MSSSLAAAPARAGTVITVRRVVVHGLLFILLMVFASGLADLLAAALHGFAVDAAGSSQLPMALASVLVAGPLAWVLWRRLAPQLASGAESASPVWSLQAAAVSVVSLVIWVAAALSLLGSLAAGHLLGWQEHLGQALGWGVLWLWQHRVLRDSRLAPRRLDSLGWVVGGYYAMLLAALSLVALLRTALQVLDPGNDTLAMLQSSGWQPFAGLAVWAAGSLLLWAWHWFGLQVRRASGGLANFMLVAAVATAAAATLLGLAFLLDAVLPFPAASLTERMSATAPLAAGFALAGALAWIYHAAYLGTRERAVHEAGRQVVSGIALALAASGLGMIANALLAAFSAPLAGAGPGEVLRVGIALFACGAVAWLVFWKPFTPTAPETRRIYLVLVFGLSALVALVALLVVGYRIFAFFLTPQQSGPNLLGEVRAAVGLLIATAAVFAYHFAVWRSDRDRAGEADGGGSGTTGSVQNVVLVAGGDVRALAVQLAHATGSTVRGLQRTAPGDGVPLADDGISLELIREALHGLPEGTDHVLVLVEHGGLQLVPLAAKPW